MRPRGLRERLYSLLWRLGLRVRALSSVHREVFTGIYAHNEWGSAESRSGGGSTRERGAHFRDALLDVLERFAIRSIVDAPCGDFNWMRDIVDERHAYTGIDIVEELIAANREQHGSANRRFLCGDLTRDALPQADLILCRDCLVHFSYADIRAAIANCKRSGAKYLLTTTFPGAANRDIRTGGWRPLNLQAPPFGFPPPVATIDEVPAGVQHDYPDKKLCLWELASL
jgi:SAM-dependent methyltransferase